MEKSTWINKGTQIDMPNESNDEEPMKFRKNYQKFWKKNFFKHSLSHMWKWPKLRKQPAIIPFGIFSCHFGKPHNHIHKIHSDILNWYWWMRNTQEPIRWVFRSRRSSLWWHWWPIKIYWSCCSSCHLNGFEWSKLYLEKE